MKDMIVTKHSLQQLMDEIQVLLDEHGTIVVSAGSARIGKWTMTRLWRAWMSTIARHMAAKGITMPLMVRSDGTMYGSRPFSAEDAHELFVAQMLGLDKDGKRLSFSKTGRDGMRAATKGERFIAMQRVHEWATERGIQLLVPRDSEYAAIRDESDGSR